MAPKTKVLHLIKLSMPFYFGPLGFGRVVAMSPTRWILKNIVQIGHPQVIKVLRLILPSGNEEFIVYRGCEVVYSCSWPSTQNRNLDPFQFWFAVEDEQS